GDPELSRPPVTPLLARRADGVGADDAVRRLGGQAELPEPAAVLAAQAADQLGLLPRRGAVRSPSNGIVPMGKLPGRISEFFLEKASAQPQYERESGLRLPSFRDRVPET